MHRTRILLLVLLASCGEPASVVEVDEVTPAAASDARFLSYTVDVDKVVRQRFDFDQPRLLGLAGELGPAYLRVGGTVADSVFYDLSGSPVAEAPAPYESVLTREVWDGMCGFADALGVEIMFTLNAGPGPRDTSGRWVADQARELIRYSRSVGCPVVVWELGNEVGAFSAVHGFTLDGPGYAADWAIARAMLLEEDPDARLAGPASAYWPVFGEVPMRLIPGFLETAGDTVDILTWHYYPWQSATCPVFSRPIGDDPLLGPDELDEVDRWADDVTGLRDLYAPSAEIWLNETGHAQCGGEPGVSDRFVSSLWWLDQLGRIARRGQPMVARQALVGGAYNLVHEATLTPRPDWYASVLWQRLMGIPALSVGQRGEALEPTTRIYAHCTPGVAGAVTTLILNLDRENEAEIHFDAGLGSRRRVYRLTAELLSETVALNGELLEANADGTLDELSGEATQGPVTVAPASVAFVVHEDAAAGACSGP